MLQNADLIVTLRLLEETCLDLSASRVSGVMSEAAYGWAGKGETGVEWSEVGWAKSGLCVSSSQDSRCWLC